MSEAQSVQELREKVAISCRVMGNREVTRGASGHVSARIPGTNRILIKGKGDDEEALEFARARDVITIDIEGDVLEAPRGLTRPHETAMHLAVYRARPEVQSVIHVHPFWAVALMACEAPLVPMCGAYDGSQSLRLLDEGIPVYPRSVTIVDDELGADFMRVMGDKKACLLRGHGMTAAGASVEQATLICLQLFEIERLNYLAYAVSAPKPVPDIEDHRRRQRDGGGRPGVWRAAAGEPSDWRYNKKLLQKQGL